MNRSKVLNSDSLENFTPKKNQSSGKFEFTDLPHGFLSFREGLEFYIHPHVWI